MPIGWLQLSHSKGRMFAAIAGVAFANVLVFVQLGILGALSGTINFSYNPLSADILVSSSNANTLTDGVPLSRRWLWKVLAVPGVSAASPLYLGKVDWLLPNEKTASLTVYGLPIEATAFSGSLLSDKLKAIAIPGTALLDRRTRGLDTQTIDALFGSKNATIELSGTKINIVGDFELGGGFSADGALIVSDQTFLTLFPNRSSGTPSHLLVNLVDGTQVATMVNKLMDIFSNEPLKIRSMAKAQAEDLAYQTTQRPIGVIFGMGVFIGILVGLVIVYQVLSTDVADHLREYATFKAIGYRHSFFLGIVFEEAIILAILGFIPGLSISLLIYEVMSTATGLPVAMDISRASLVFIGTIAACTLSGAFATRRLKSADPAELF
ncbi:ABC transporter permease DevC [Saccharophagus degradans]|nr:ABC transporter permease DevC [Saccharophagus degradans]